MNFITSLMDSNFMLHLIYLIHLLIIILYNLIYYYTFFLLYLLYPFLEIHLNFYAFYYVHLYNLDIMVLNNFLNNKNLLYSHQDVLDIEKLIVT